jgi:dTDP-4-dehydrorhamnose reductase
VKRALVTGAAGLLGQHIINRMAAEYQVTGVDIAPNPFEEKPTLSYIKSDLSVPGRIQEIVSDLPPDLIINCAAYTDVDGCERNRELANRLNVGLVEDLLCIAAGKIIHYSTDYVFDGRSGPYAEEDPTSPLGYYGSTKLLSEEKLLDSRADTLIIRSNVLFGTAVSVRPNFITWLIDSLRAGKRLNIVTDQFNNPIHAGHLAEASIEAATIGLRGVWHIAGRDYLSRYDIAIKVAEFFNLDQNLITPITTDQLGQTALRPLRGGLKVDKAAGALRMPIPGFEDGLKLMAEY